MNKARRHQLKMLKYKRRLKRIGLYSATTMANPKGVDKGVHYNLTGFRNSSKPCSCSMCRREKYNRAKENNSIVKEKAYMY